MIIDKVNKKTSIIERKTEIIGLFYGAYLMLALAIFLGVGLIKNSAIIWGSLFFICLFGFLFLGLLTHAVILLKYKE